LKRLLLELAPVFLGSLAWAQVTQRVSVTTSGKQSNYHSFTPAISADGRYVLFTSDATNLVPRDENGLYDVFLRDRREGTTELVSVSSTGEQANSYCNSGAISADGRFVAFYGTASNLAPGDTNTYGDVFVRDRSSGTTELVSFGSIGIHSGEPSISADGRYVAFVSGIHGFPRVFVRDRQSGALEVASGPLSDTQQPSDTFSGDATISADGSCVAFSSYVNDLAPGDTDGFPDVFVYDRRTEILECVSVSSRGVQGGRLSFSPSLSADGSIVAFASFGANLVPDDTNQDVDVFVRDRAGGRTDRVSVDPNGIEGNGPSYAPILSGDGRYLAFTSEATNLVPNDTNGAPDVFVRDLVSGTTERVNLSWNGAEGDHACFGCLGKISENGRFVVFDSFASNFVPGDTNGWLDVFVRDLAPESFVVLCEPGISGAMRCPCSNPPAGPERGCDNSAATGGASLSARGGDFLSSDSLVFTTSNESPGASSLLLQGSRSLRVGAAFGHGVRCVAGSLRRLYTGSATGGSITAPRFGLGEPAVHDRSAALGDPISAGSTRWYAVLYRDPGDVGSCRGSSRYNSTQVIEATWSP
jgi:Tol biopolymer transport system component